MKREEFHEIIKHSVRSAFLRGDRVYETTIDAVLEEAAKVAESAMLPCDIGGDLILDRYTSETIATAIRKLKGE